MTTSKAAGNNKIVNGCAQEYLSDLLETYVLMRSLGFATQGFLAVPKSLTSTFADQAFSSCCTQTLVQPASKY